jgi:hypothetical protein
MRSSAKAPRASLRVRTTLAGLVVCSTVFVVGPPAHANPPNQMGVNTSDGAAAYAPESPAYEAPRPAGAGTGRKIG